MEWECLEQVLARQDTNSKSKGRIFRTCSCIRSLCSCSAFKREFSLLKKIIPPGLHVRLQRAASKAGRTFSLSAITRMNSCTRPSLTTVTGRRRAVQDDVMTYARANRHRRSWSQRRASSIDTLFKFVSESVGEHPVSFLEDEDVQRL